MLWAGRGTLRYFREKSGYSIEYAALSLSISVEDLRIFEEKSGETPCGVIMRICRLYAIPSADLII